VEKDKISLELAKQDWQEIHARLIKFCRKRGTSRELAEDLTQQAITRVFAFDSEWDPTRYPAILPYLMGVVKMLLFKERRAGKRIVSHDHHDDGDGDDKHGKDGLADPRAPGPEKLEEADLHSRSIALLRARLEKRGQKEALRVLELALAGVETPADLALATGWSDAEVIMFRLRMRRAALEVAHDLADDDDGEDEVS
jgi:DNA-directed RNA polymerase specialized sigma24 family protein